LKTDGPGQAAGGTSVEVQSFENTEQGKATSNVYTNGYGYAVEGAVG
jgi:hypothetical protein